MSVNINYYATNVELQDIPSYSTNITVEGQLLKLSFLWNERIGKRVLSIKNTSDVVYLQNTILHPNEPLELNSNAVLDDLPYSVTLVKTGNNKVGNIFNWSKDFILCFSRTVDLDVKKLNVVYGVTTPSTPTIPPIVRPDPPNGGNDVVISAIYDSFYQTMTVTGDAGLVVATKDAQGVVLGLGVIGSDGTVTYPLNIEGQTDNAPIYTKSDFSNTVSHFLVIDTNWDIEYVLNGTTYREVTGNPIPYQHMWKDPERFSSSLVINNTVTVVGQQAFRGWVNAVSLTIGDSVQVIHPQAFQYWEALQYLMIPASVTEIWEEAFYGAKSLISITVLAVNPPNLREVNAFRQNSLTRANIYVPAESVGAYKAAPNWSAYANNIFPIPS